MKNRVLKLISGILAMMVFPLAGCIESKPEPIMTGAVAYPLKAEQMKAKNLSTSTDYYAENLISYVNASGQTVLRLFTAPVEDSENAIKHSEGGGYTGDGNYMQKSLPEVWSPDAPIHITNGGSFAELTPAGDGKYTSKQAQTINLFGQGRDTVVYQDAFGSSADLSCSLTSFGVNMEIVFPKRPEKNTYQIKLKLPELVPDTGSPDYILFKTALEKGEVRTILETPLIADQSGKWSYANSVRLVAKDSAAGVYTVEYTVDEAFLADKTTKYPVRVNQSVSLYKSKQPDTTAYEKTGDTAGHYLSPYSFCQG